MLIIRKYAGVRTIITFSRSASLVTADWLNIRVPVNVVIA